MVRSKHMHACKFTLHVTDDDDDDFGCYFFSFLSLLDYFSIQTIWDNNRYIC